MGVADVLIRAEHQLRAQGLTGAAAFEQLLVAIRRRLGDPVQENPRLDDLLMELDLTEEIDLLGLAYERFFSDLFKGKRGQFFTPRPLVSLLLSLLELRPGERVLDPTCGTGGFLVCAARQGAVVSGIELDPRLAQLAQLNLRLAGFDAPIRQGDLFQASPEPVDVVVANPPFSVTISDPKILERFDLGHGRARVLSDWLFVEAMESWVRPGGRAGIVLPWSVLNSPTTQKLRERIDSKWSKTAIVTLPEGVFRPFGGAAGRVCMLVLEREGPSGQTRWGAIHDPGYDVRSRYHRPTLSDEVPQLMRGERWQTLAQGAWTPDADQVGRRMKDVASLRRKSVAASDLSGNVDVLELADTNRRTGEVSPRRVAAATLKGRRQRVVAGDVLVSRMRPELGNVVMSDRDCVGSPEWIALQVPVLPHWVLHALRTPSWRASLPVTEGQTRPRTSAQAVLDTAVTWPSDDTATAVNNTSRAIHERRRALEAGLQALQRAVDAHAAGEWTDAQLRSATNQIHAELGLP